jgi:hypothetical protein
MRRETVSSLAPASAPGDHVITGAGPRITSGIGGSGGEQIPSTCDPARRQRRGHPVEPACLAAQRRGRPILKHVLPIEVGPLAIGRRDRVYRQRMALVVKRLQSRQVRVQAEDSIQGERRAFPRPRECEIAAQGGIVGVAYRRHEGQTVERAAQDHEDEAGIPATCRG